MKGFGESVRWRRIALGLSQSELARKTLVKRRPVAQSHISRIEAGKLEPSLGLVRSLAKALKCKPWQLVAEFGENTEFWRTYLELTGPQKREVQRYMKYLVERR